jgi:hypothetical protein
MRARMFNHQNHYLAFDQDSYFGQWLVSEPTGPTARIDRTRMEGARVAITRDDERVTEEMK